MPGSFLAQVIGQNNGLAEATVSHNGATGFLSIEQSLSSIARSLSSLPSIEKALQRIADKQDPPADDKPVGTPYVADLLGQTTTWVAEMARRGMIPASCVVPGTGNGKPWKFYPAKIDEWMWAR